MPRSTRFTRQPIAVVFCVSMLLFPVSALARSKSGAAEKNERSQRYGGLPIMIRIQVTRANSVAAKALQDHAECQALFEALGADGLDAIGRVNYKLGERDLDRPLCSRLGVAAYTTLYTDTTWLCQLQFSKLDRWRTANLIIHEALHHCGLTEYPSDPEAMTAPQISQLVRDRCGL